MNREAKGSEKRRSEALPLVGPWVMSKFLGRHFGFSDLGWGGKGLKLHSEKTQLDMGFWEMGFP